MKLVKTVFGEVDERYSKGAFKDTESWSKEMYLAIQEDILELQKEASNFIKKVSAAYGIPLSYLILKQDDIPKFLSMMRSVRDHKGGQK